MASQVDQFSSTQPAALDALSWASWNDGTAGVDSEGEGEGDGEVDADADEDDDGSAADRTAAYAVDATDATDGDTAGPPGAAVRPSGAGRRGARGRGGPRSRKGHRTGGNTTLTGHRARIGSMGERETVLTRP
ncbi:hypothetical protein GCM10010259_24860 [Streptomyces daghestanicus]|uniref:Uncharacterized protein n=1 Tax=Streptomyces daghestanicus TaxID=66885 RepID=A0ABQ3QAD2_9ACTN|nr:hypothetical protein GCM10010259_24860 [Streptomyces daghestanicus]GHI34194.1 hypothetical protein Sdagh_59240 [Streptomyces daghestanicus]